MGHIADPPVAVTLENRLMGQGIYLTSFDSNGDRTRIEYEMVHDLDGVTTHEVSQIVRTVLTVTDERSDWEPGRLEARSFSTDGDCRGSWHVEREWFDELGSGLTDLEFSQRVLATIGLESNTKEVD